MVLSLVFLKSRQERGMAGGGHNKRFYVFVISISLAIRKSVGQAGLINLLIDIAVKTHL
jgi:hypothetical protein